MSAVRHPVLHGRALLARVPAGYYERNLPTKAGEVRLKLPKLRE
jgi:hypothetical protein